MFKAIKHTDLHLIQVKLQYHTKKRLFLKVVFYAESTVKNTVKTVVL